MRFCDRCQRECKKPRYSVDLVQTQFTHKKRFVCWDCLNYLDTLHEECLRGVNFTEMKHNARDVNKRADNNNYQNTKGDE